MKSAPTDNLISLPAAAHQLDISVRGLYRLIARKEIPSPVKVGGASKLFESDLETYKVRLKEQRTI
jgi:predicted DNA-binding transcriptional regulator AlpA